jgi:ParB/RepB/Spo0J family partition protein
MSEKRNMSVVSRVIAGGLVAKTTEAPTPATQKEQKPTNFVQTKSGIGERMRELDPYECRLWKFADRPESEALHAQDLAEEFLSGVGQLHPAIVREIPRDDVDYPTIKYEVISGSVRWRASKIAQRPLKSVIRELNDKEAITIMLSENEARKNISEFSRAKQIGLVWDSGIYETKGEAAHAHRMAAGKFSQYLKVYEYSGKLKEMFADQVSTLGLRNLYEATLSFEDSADSAEILSEQNRVADIRAMRGKSPEPSAKSSKSFISYKASKKETGFFVQTKLSDEQSEEIQALIEEAIKSFGITQ